MLEKLFLQILNMSFTGGIVIVFVLFFRLLLKKAPKVFSYGLWAVALCRICAASVISSMKVDCALARSSAAPIRVWMASIGPRQQALAGTWLPMLASSTMMATCRM